MSTAFIYRMPAGIAGDVTRREHADIEPQIMDANYPVLRYGEPVKMVSGKIRPIANGDTDANIYGFGVRPFPAASATSEAIATATPSVVQPIDVLVRGYMTVKVQDGLSPAKHAQPYVRTVAASNPTTQPIGGLETTADSSDCHLIDKAYFMGEGDADGNVEISWNL